jgi:hypothetical protein
MDAEVVAISRLLAVGALQVMRYQHALPHGAVALAYATNAVTFSLACICMLLVLYRLCQAQTVSGCVDVLVF